MVFAGCNNPQQTFALCCTSGMSQCSEASIEDTSSETSIHLNIFKNVETAK